MQRLFVSVVVYSMLHREFTFGALTRTGYVYKTPFTSFDKVTAPSFLSTTGVSPLPPLRIPLPAPHEINKYQIKFENFPNGGLDHNYLLDQKEIYVANGRILKQYEVMESIPEDQLPDNFLEMSPLLLESFLTKYGRISPSLIPLSSPLSPISLQPFQQTTFDISNGGRRRGPIIQPVTRNHGPVALGSGSLGYIQLSNGGIFLGSGSLGYITGQERLRAITDARTRKGPPSSPVNFGPGPITF